MGHVYLFTILCYADIVAEHTLLTLLVTELYWINYK